MTGLIPGPVPGEVLLLGVVGSTAYGLRHAGSDIDRAGVFAAPSLAFGEMDEPADSVGFKAPDPDVALHEARKFVRLALNCNPSVLELLWLTEYDVLHPLGEALVGIRTAFLSRERVRRAYLGYVDAQWRKIMLREPGEDEGKRRARESKHARHLLRLAWQGLHLYRTGELVVRVSDPDGLRAFGYRVADGDRDELNRVMTDVVGWFNAPRQNPVLPAEPDAAAAAAWLRDVRRAFTPDAGLRGRVIDLAARWSVQHRDNASQFAAELSDELAKETS